MQHLCERSAQVPVRAVEEREGRRRLGLPEERHAAGARVAVDVHEECPAELANQTSATKATLDD